MGLTAGIVGLPNVGKSTLFNAITKQNILAANYPFATIDPNVGMVIVPDDRIDKLNCSPITFHDERFFHYDTKKKRTNKPIFFYNRKK